MKSSTAPSRADSVVVFPLCRWCPPQETPQPHPPPTSVQTSPFQHCFHMRNLNSNLDCLLIFRCKHSQLAGFGVMSTWLVFQHSPLSRGSGLRDCSLFLTGHSKTGIRIRPRALGAWGFIGITGSRGLAAGILGRKDVSLK